jgi:hypothetical protein
MPEVEQTKAVSENDWAGTCVSKARIGAPLVTDSASNILTVSMRGLLSERTLTSSELTTLANHLIDDMNPSQPAPSDAVPKQ